MPISFAAVYESVPAYRVISRQCIISVDFEPKRTLSRIYEYTSY